jgi:hypothetical protein
VAAAGAVRGDAGPREPRDALWAEQQWRAPLLVPRRLPDVHVLHERRLLQAQLYHHLRVRAHASRAPRTPGLAPNHPPHPTMDPHHRSRSLLVVLFALSLTPPLACATGPSWWYSSLESGYCDAHPTDETCSWRVVAVEKIVDRKCHTRVFGDFVQSAPSAQDRRPLATTRTTKSSHHPTPTAHRSSPLTVHPHHMAQRTAHVPLDRSRPSRPRGRHAAVVGVPGRMRRPKDQHELAVLDRLLLPGGRRS